LPVVNLVHDLVGDLRHQIRLNTHAVNFFEMTFDSRARHTAGKHRNDLAVKAIKAPLTFFDDLQLETGVAVSGDGKLPLPVITQQSFRAMAVARIAGLLALHIPFS